MEKFIGDAVMALFGAPTAHEDDPERGVRAALAIRDWAREREDLSVRVGLTTGEVLVMLDAEAAQAMAAGDVVNTASRLQAAAPENGILVDQTTYRTTEHAIEYREAAAADAKGKQKPVPVWEALDAKARFGTDFVKAGAPLVGRQRELGVLFDAFARARSTHDPQLVTLVGVPGIGKSRLVYEFFQQGIQPDRELISWRQGRCLPYGEGVTYWAVGEMVKAQAGILDTDSAEAAAGKLADAVDSAVGRDATWVEPPLRPLVGVGDVTELGEDRRADAHAAWRRFFEGLAEQRPLVLVFEDLHWADAGLLDFVDDLVAWASEVPLTVVCTARPELLDRRPGWGGGKINATTLGLSPLSDVETAQLVGELTGRTLLPVDAQRSLLDRAGGNPLYAEQYARMLDERGSIDDLALPETIQGLIAARLDLLKPEEKALIQDAAVVGKVFWPRALDALGDHGSIEDTLRSLERKEFVRRQRRSTVEGATEYAFRHLLVQDVAYGQIPRPGRAEKHRRAAEWIESLSERTDDFAEMVSHHFLAALELTKATGKGDPALVDRTRAALREAGDRAASLNAFEAAARFYGRAVELASDEDECADLLFLYGKAEYWRAEQGGGEALESALAHFEAAGELERAAEAESILAGLAQTRGEHDRALERHRHAAALAEDAPPSRSKAFVLANFARFHMVGSDPEAIPVAQEALRIADTLGLRELRAYALNMIGTTRAFRGDPGGLDDLEQALADALEANSPTEIIRAYNNLGSCSILLGDLTRGFEYQAKGRETAERFGNVFRIRWLRVERVIQDYLTGRWDEALRASAEFMAETESGSPHYMALLCRSMRGAIRVARGDIDGGLADTEGGLSDAQAIRDPQLLYPALSRHAAALVLSGRLDEAASVAQQLLEEWRGTSTYTAGDWIAPLASTLALLGRGRPSSMWRSRKFTRAGSTRPSSSPRETSPPPPTSMPRWGPSPTRPMPVCGLAANPRYRRALEFFRSVSAVRYVQEGEALLARTA